MWGPPMGSSVTPSDHALKAPGTLAGADSAGTTIGAHGTLDGGGSGGGTTIGGGSGTLGHGHGAIGGGTIGGGTIAIAFAKWPAMAWL